MGKFGSYEGTPTTKEYSIWDCIGSILGFFAVLGFIAGLGILTLIGLIQFTLWLI